MDYKAIYNEVTGGTGSTPSGPYAGMTSVQIAAALQAKTVPAPQPALLTPSSILNACVPADLASLTAAQIAELTLLLAGAQVDASKGTTIRAAVQAIFAGKTQTLQNLAALVAPYDNASIPFARSQAETIDPGAVDFALMQGAAGRL